MSGKPDRNVEDSWPSTEPQIRRPWAEAGTSPEVRGSCRAENRGAQARGRDQKGMVVVEGGVDHDNGELGATLSVTFSHHNADWALARHGGSTLHTLNSYKNPIRAGQCYLHFADEEAQKLQVMSTGQE